MFNQLFKTKLENFFCICPPFKGRCITRLLFVLNGLYIFDVHFQMHVISKKTQGFSFFCTGNALPLVYFGYESGGNDLKATGDVATIK